MKRYFFRWDGETVYREEDELGDYVSYEDIKQSLAETGKIANELREWYAQFERAYDAGYLNLDRLFEKLMKIIAKLEAPSA